MVVVRARLRVELAAAPMALCWKLLGVNGRSGCAALSLPKETLLMARLRLPLPELSPRGVLLVLL